MNVTDVKKEEAWKEAVEQFKTEDPIKIIFSRQQELLNRYLPIEEKVIGIRVSNVPVDIHSAKDQVHLKQRAWWTTEEIAESLDAWIGEKNELKAIEELGDSLHFLTELLILVGITPEEAQRGLEQSLQDHKERSPLNFEDRFRCASANYLRELGMAAWQLRCKPWKQNQILTDRQELERKLVRAWGKFWVIVDLFGLSVHEMALLYLQKSVVNKFRIRSNY